MLVALGGEVNSEVMSCRCFFFQIVGAFIYCWSNDHKLPDSKQESSKLRLVTRQHHSFPWWLWAEPGLSFVLSFLNPTVVRCVQVQVHPLEEKRS